MNRKQRHYWFGHAGEWLASVYMQLKGYRIMARRLKTPVGEIDLLFRRKDLLVVAEVKAHSAYTAEVLTAHQRERLVRAAKWLLSGRPELATCSLRFDLIIVTPPLRIRHIENAWGE